MQEASIELGGVLFEIEYEATEYVPAVIHLAPEDCYPEEPSELTYCGLLCASVFDGMEELPQEYAEYLYGKYENEIINELVLD